MNPDDVIEKIENVEIQGASSVAEAGVRLLKQTEESGDDTDAVAERLKKARPTEPFLFNSIRIARETGDYDAVLEHIEKSRDAIREHGASVVGDGDTVYTHCHSSTVTESLIAAFGSTEFDASVTETRPLYQGRTTARELADAGVDVELYVDSGARIALKDADLMAIGADAITESGKVINKIGSEMFAEVAQSFGVPVYVFTDSWKFDPRSAFGYEEDLERRVASEVWEEPPDGVEVVNYAFERVSPENVDYVVSELGVHEPRDFVDEVTRAYDYL